MISQVKQSEKFGLYVDFEGKRAFLSYPAPIRHDAFKRGENYEGEIEYFVWVGNQRFSGKERTVLISHLERVKLDEQAKKRAFQYDPEKIWMCFETRPERSVENVEKEL